MSSWNVCSLWCRKEGSFCGRGCTLCTGLGAGAGPSRLRGASAAGPCDRVVSTPHANISQLPSQDARRVRPYTPSHIISGLRAKGEMNDREKRQRGVGRTVGRRTRVCARVMGSEWGRQQASGSFQEPPWLLLQRMRTGTSPAGLPEPGGDSTCARAWARCLSLGCPGCTWRRVCCKQLMWEARVGGQGSEGREKQWLILAVSCPLLWEPVTDGAGSMDRRTCVRRESREPVQSGTGPLHPRVQAAGVLAESAHRGTIRLHTSACIITELNPQLLPWKPHLL